MSDVKNDRRTGYEFPLITQLETCINIFCQDRDEYWQSRLDAEEWSRLKELRADADRLASVIRKRAKSMLNVGDLSELNAIYHANQCEIDSRRESFLDLIREKLKDSPDALRQLIEDLNARQFPPFEYDPYDIDSDEPMHLIGEAIAIADAFDAVSSIGERVNRILNLERVVCDVFRDVHPPEGCIRFLALVSRCYINGFDPECIVMCRSAMEEAFRTKVGDEHCERVTEPKRREDHEYSLSVRINASCAPANQLLANESEVIREAWAVKKRGDKVVHGYETDATRDAIGTIRSTLRVIDALSKFPGVAE